MEMITLGLFGVVLLLSIITGISVVWAMAAGFVIFFLYGLRKGNSAAQVAHMCFEGVKTARNILISFILIGILTAFWRSCGTIAEIVCCAAPFLNPAVFLLMAFLLNCLVSFLTGTAFGTAATMGVICAAMGTALQVPVLFTGGAILSGVFFGDRCSPVSTSMLLTAELTHTNTYDNIRKMFLTAAVPFAVCCVLYLAMGFLITGTGEVPDFISVFRAEYNLSPLLLLPAAVILLLAALRVNVKLAMTASILTAIPLCLFLKGMSPALLITTALTGFHASDPSAAALMNGGGIISMVRSAFIVGISSAYSGIFKATGLLDGIRKHIEDLGKRTVPFFAVLVTSVLTSMVACNQTLSTLLTHQLCSGSEPDDVLAIDLENSVILVAGLIPWSIAGGVPLSSVGAPTASIPFAFYLWVVPLWTLLCAVFRSRTSQ